MTKVTVVDCITPDGGIVIVKGTYDEVHNACKTDDRWIKLTCLGFDGRSWRKLEILNEFGARAFAILGDEREIEIAEEGEGPEGQTIAQHFPDPNAAGDVHVGL